jgi:CRP-like cAMP-binding protein
MRTRFAFESKGEAAIRRLATLAPLNHEALAALEMAAAHAERVPAHREIVGEGKNALQPSIVLSGWACRMRLFSDGRRQILSFLLPGELIGMCDQPEPLSATTIVAMTEMTLCRAPAREAAEGLAQIYAMSRALEEYYLFRQIARIGRMSAYERLLDWLLEMRERLALSGLASDDSLPMPLTQEGLADALGLTSVHVNRTLQLMRREGLIDLRGGMARLHDPERLRGLVDYRPARVSGLTRGAPPPRRELNFTDSPPVT